jgi:hypothetical protein
VYKQPPSRCAILYLQCACDPWLVECHPFLHTVTKAGKQHVSIVDIVFNQLGADEAIVLVLKHLADTTVSQIDRQTSRPIIRENSCIVNPGRQTYGHAVATVAMSTQAW